MNYRPLADIHGYRGVLYDVFERGSGDWEWNTIPKRESA
jgi:hypothetical protein